MIKATYDVSYMVYNNQGILNVGTVKVYNFKKNIPFVLDCFLKSEFSNEIVVIITNITWLSFRNLTK